METGYQLSKTIHERNVTRRDGNWGCEALHMGNSDFSKPLAPSAQTNVLPFAVISAVTSHPALPVTKLGLPPMGRFCASPAALLFVPWPQCSCGGQWGAHCRGQQYQCQHLLGKS